MKLLIVASVVLTLIKSQSLESRFNFGNYNPWGSGSLGNAEHRNVWESQISNSASQPQPQKYAKLSAKGISQQSELFKYNALLCI
jgi:hypothetical protein